MRAHLASSSMAHGVVAAPDGSILGMTAAMDKMVGSVNGQSLWEFLTPESAEELRGRVEAGRRSPESRFPMTFIGADSSQHVLICSLDVQPNAFALMCERTK